MDWILLMCLFGCCLLPISLPHLREHEANGEEDEM